MKSRTDMGLIRAGLSVVALTGMALVWALASGFPAEAQTPPVPPKATATASPALPPSPAISPVTPPAPGKAPAPAAPAAPAPAKTGNLGPSGPGGIAPAQAAPDASVGNAIAGDLALGAMVSALAAIVKGLFPDRLTSRVTLGIVAGVALIVIVVQVASNMLPGATPWDMLVGWVGLTATAAGLRSAATTVAPALSKLPSR